MSEQNFQYKVLQFLKSKNIYAVKVMMANKNGTPDIIACIKGRFVAIECKDKQKQPSKLQLYTLEVIKEAGGIPLVAYPANFSIIKTVITNML